MAEMKTEPQSEHQWLQKFVGEWTYETEASMGPDTPTEKCTGAETARSLGGLWIVGEGTGEMPGGGAASTVVTVGYNPQTKRFVGTWVGSMMTHLWVYDGWIEGNSLVLESEGPDFVTEGKTAKYRDVTTFEGDDHRSMTSYAQTEDGEWKAFMTVHYQRRK
jgi:hypothetical protein